MSHGNQPEAPATVGRYCQKGQEHGLEKSLDKTKLLDICRPAIEEGKPVREQKGELVCTKPFASMPVKFWNDPEGRKYHAAYFERFPGIWCHGDFAEWTAIASSTISPTSPFAKRT